MLDLFPVCPPLLCAMAGDPQTEYVSAQYVTRQGQQQTLSFARGAALGDFVVSSTHPRAMRRGRKIGRRAKEERGREAEVGEWEANIKGIM